MLIRTMIDNILRLLLWLLYYVVITTIINSIVTGVLHVRFTLQCKTQEFVITKANRFEMQMGNQQGKAGDRDDTNVGESELAAFCSCGRL